MEPNDLVPFRKFNFQLCTTLHGMKSIDGNDVSLLQKKWKPGTKPIEYVKDGEEFSVVVPDSSSKQIRMESDDSILSEMDTSLLDAAVGPVFVEGAKKGDIVEISIHDINVGDWGWSSISPDFGLLKGRFSNRLFIWKIGAEYAEPYSNFLRGVRIPVEPFLGVIATAPSTGEYGMIPPQYFGGNMDNRLLKKGARLRLPVNVEGALISFGDPHACQGDGEVCGTAVETTASVNVSVHIIHSEAPLEAPVANSSERCNRDVLVCMGIDPDLKKASIKAVDSMIKELKKMGYSDEESYVLCSVAGNLRISEIVDEPNLVVSMTIPRDIFK